MHRGRFGGNARKRKTKLTDATFKAVLSAAPAAGAVVVLEPETPEDEPDVVLPVNAGWPTADPISRVERSGVFCCQDYHFGYANCGSCRNDQAYYIHRALLVDGYTFRCRICRHEMTVARQS